MLAVALLLALPSGFELPVRADLGEAEIEGEDAVLADTVTVLTDLVTKKLAAQSSKEGDHALRDVHAKSSGCMTARFIVKDPPPALRHGLFAKDGTYAAFVRFSSSELQPDDDDWGASFRGMAIKISGVEGTKLVDLADGEHDTQDFLLNNWSTFPMADARAYHDAMVVRRDGALAALFFAPTHLSSVPALAASKRIESPLKTEYFSQAPIEIGPAATKLVVRPCIVRRTRLPAEHGPSYLREAARQQLAHRDACFDLYAQVRTAANATFTPVEDASVVWSEEHAPLERIARIEIPPQDIDNPAVVARCEEMKFSPWHTLPEHRPLGSLNRARLSVYRALAEFRAAHQGPVAVATR